MNPGAGLSGLVQCQHMESELALAAGKSAYRMFKEEAHSTTANALHPRSFAADRNRRGGCMSFYVYVAAPKEILLACLGSSSTALMAAVRSFDRRQHSRPPAAVIIIAHNSDRRQHSRPAAVSIIRSSTALPACGRKNHPITDSIPGVRL